jgi:hypothetical protein
LFDNDQPLCFLEIEVGIITSRTPEDVRYLIEHRDSYPRKISGSMVPLDSLGGDLSAAKEIGNLIRDQKLPADRFLRQMRERLCLRIGGRHPTQDQRRRWQQLGARVETLAASDGTIVSITHATFASTGIRAA